jgi:hypothetical protein
LTAPTHLCNAVADAEASEAGPLAERAHDQEIGQLRNQGDSGAAGSSKLSVGLVDNDHGVERAELKTGEEVKSRRCPALPRSIILQLH